MQIYPSRIVAHRGGGTLAPENTLAAMRCGLAHAFHAVEFDVMLSRDEVPMVNHDPELGRTVSGGGRVCDLTAQELLLRDAGSWHGAAFAGEPMPTYEQVWRFCVANNIWMNVEIKPVPGFETRTGSVVAQTTARLLEQTLPRLAAERPPVLFSSFSSEALMGACAVSPHIPRALLVRELPSDWHGQLEYLGAVALHIRYDHLTPRSAADIKGAGFGLMTYTVNDPGRARELLSWGVDALCTDRLDLIGADFS
jgi:glycerophosphoryl diester phosphodiesterase